MTEVTFAIVMRAWAFGWSHGKGLVKESLAEAKVKAAEQQAARKARKEAKHRQSEEAGA